MTAGVEVGDKLPALTLGSFLADITGRHGDREALAFDDPRGDAALRLRYRDLDAAARELARALIGAGVVKGARVAVLTGSRPEWVVAFFAVGLVGGVLVPVNTFASGPERDYILRHSDASLLILQPELLQHRYLDDLLADHPALGAGEPGRLLCPAFPHLRRVVATRLDEPRGSVQSWAELLALGGDVPEELLDAARREVSPADDAILIYTSGTTARPKAVLHMQRAALVNGLRFSRWMELGPEDRVFTAQPFFWTAGITMSLVSTLDAGASLLLQEHFEPGRALDWIERERATTLHAWVHQHKALGEHPSARQRDLSSVRRLDPNSPLAARAAKPPGVSPARAWGLQGSYGLSETFTIFSTLPADAPRELRVETNGRPLPGNALRILDPGSGLPLPAGEHGEIAVKGPTLMRGYYKVEPESYLDADGYFHTQDGGFVDEAGILHWTGRLSTLIKTGGANVSPVEIEEQLREFPPLRVALAVGVPHPTLDEAIVLCAVRREDTPPTSEEAVRTFLRERLSAYKVPRRVLFFDAAELSYTANQKIQYAPLREKALARLHADHVEIAGHVY